MPRPSAGKNASSHVSSRICLVHYHEIGLKGHNRKIFERRLFENIEAALASYPVHVSHISGHLLVTLDGGCAIDDVAGTVASVPGVVKVSLGWRSAREIGEICRFAQYALDECQPFDTFKVAARRSNTDFEMDSMELNRVVGAHLCSYAPDKAVKMKDPDAVVGVYVIQGSCYVYSKAIIGVGGLPVGTAGRVVSLLSAGIDSPVATWKLVHRGAIAICLHFSGRPQTSDSSEYLVREIVEQLSPAAGIPRLYIVPFGDYQREISLNCPPALRVILYRRLMFAVALKVAAFEKAQALVTGESLGQVASQTLSNIRATDDVCDLPVFRPLIGTDKQEIVAAAQALGTFDISIRNQNDCCTLFMPKNPETHANLQQVREVWETLPIEQWLDEIIANIELFEFACPAYRSTRKINL